jgi:hypothetical protein
MVELRLVGQPPQHAQRVGVVALDLLPHRALSKGRRQRHRYQTAGQALAVCVA